MAFTNEQQQAIDKRGSNILVSAAAGSGKTTVLVARIINKIINQKIDIDKLLIVTFTSAAASEMKERLLKALYEEVDKNPNDENLQRQINLINKAHISTISSFCLDVIRNNFFETELSANFRVADENEVQLMKEDAIEEVFEEKYENEDKEFLKLLNYYTTYKDDQPLKDLVMKIYEFITSVPFPEKWLNEAVEDFDVENQDFANTKWGSILIDYARKQTNDSIKNLVMAKNMLEGIPNLVDCYEVVCKNMNSLKMIDFSSWDTACRDTQNIDWLKWSAKRKYEEGEKKLKDSAKQIRDEVKKNLSKIFTDWFSVNSEENLKDIKAMYPVLSSIKNLVFEFEKKFSKKKRDRNIVDFTDIEHFALKLLVNDDGSKTEIAKKYDFNEILIDEYQDSNLVQESILSSVSNGHNVFMVGDVKQSIYRFRQARPELFLDKYKKYNLIDVDAEDELEESTKIQLYKNFRSRKEVLDFTNIIFQNIMSTNLGEINYEEDEYLNLGANYDEPIVDCKPEMYVIETKDSEDIEDDEETEKEIVNNAVLEARLLCKKIKELKEQGFTYREMAVLMRSPSNVAPVYEKEMIEQNIPVFTDTSSEYLESIEIDTIISLLKIIDNPLQDIPLITVLRSPICGFTDNELIEIRLLNRENNFYYSVVEASKEENKEVLGEKLFNKVNEFFDMLNKFKKLEKEIPLDELIWQIFSDTGYYHYVRLMPNGKLRQANLRKLFEKAKDYEKISFKGLFNFITFIEKVANKKSSNMSAAKIIGENEDVVRIMSIHKSKGLEFPVVFVCNVGKKFNEQDLREKITLDQDMGIGVNYVGEGIEYSTLTKAAINIKGKKEMLSEEMRILYVALTRAKEKLIIIGTDKDAQKKLEQKYLEIEKFHGKDRTSKLNENLVGKFNRYLDWIELVYEYNDEMNFNVQIINKEDLKAVEKEEVEEQKVELNKKIDEEKYAKVKDLLEWEYEKQVEEIPTKTSVTALKNSHIKIENDVIVEDSFENRSADEVKLDKLEDLIISDEEKELAPNEKGTLIHLAMQKLEDSDYLKMIDSLNVEQYKKDYLLSCKNIFEKYVSSDLFKELLSAKEVHKEMPFYMNVKYKDTDESILLQGVIDLFYISEDDKLVLVDYKTDRNVDENILKERYLNQLEIYKLALKKSLKRDVDKTCIYSTYLNKIVEF